MKQFQDSKTEIEEILKTNNLGYLCMIDGATPYPLPITYGYHEGRIIFHCSPKGRKIEILRKSPDVGFVVAKQFGPFVPHPQGARCHAHSESVICNGKARIVEGIEERTALLNIFNKCLVPDAREILPDEAKGCYAVEILISEMTARIERDSQCRFYRYRFTS